jgi:hypothetical protein
MGTTGMLYRRNRYFDTKSGRFTQEDPTGIATGLNAYGFAEGDPVNFSDPYGLCPLEKTGIPCAVSFAAAGTSIGGGIAAVSTGVCAAGTFGVCGLASPGTIATGGAVGGLIGGLVGSAVDNREAITFGMANAKDWIKRLVLGGSIWFGGGPPPRTTIGENPPRAEQPAKPKDPRTGPRPKDPDTKDDPPQ